jgi:predicted ATPase
MNAKLIVENFGPISNVDISIRKFNILTGPQSSGKSTLSKILAIIHTYDFDVFSHSSTARKREILRNYLYRYRILNFVQPDSYWFFEDDIFSFEVKELNVKFHQKQPLENIARKAESNYLPAERIALPMLNDSLFEVLDSETSLPGYFLQFGKDFTVARSKQQVFSLPLLGVEYQFRDGKNLVEVDSRSLLLQETSSAIQANLPMLVVLQYPVNIGTVFVVEELELHAFPELQKVLLYYLVDRMKHPKLSQTYVVLPTHSPYLLSAANNLLFAAKVAGQGEAARSRVRQIVAEGAWIETEMFAAYYMENGTARSIMDPRTGLIDENALDSISQDLAGEFDQLMELYKPAKA